jgi:hypothetical protein
MWEKLTYKTFPKHNQQSIDQKQLRLNIENAVLREEKPCF